MKGSTTFKLLGGALCAVSCFALFSPSLGGVVLALSVAYAASSWGDDGLAEWRDKAERKAQGASKA